MWFILPFSKQHFHPIWQKWPPPRVKLGIALPCWARWNFRFQPFCLLRTHNLSARKSDLHAGMGTNPLRGRCYVRLIVWGRGRGGGGVHQRVLPNKCLPSLRHEAKRNQFTHLSAKQNLYKIYNWPIAQFSSWFTQSIHISVIF